MKNDKTIRIVREEREDLREVLRLRSLLLADPARRGDSGPGESAKAVTV